MFKCKKKRQKIYNKKREEKQKFLLKEERKLRKQVNTNFILK